jgi:hypothetical protein
MRNRVRKIKQNIFNYLFLVKIEVIKIYYFIFNLRFLVYKIFIFFSLLSTCVGCTYWFYEVSFDFGLYVLVFYRDLGMLFYFYLLVSSKIIRL